MSRSPRVVAIGGGHGTAVTLRAARRYAGELTAIVSVADDGGSSGRLRDLLGVPALGDVRNCISALAADDSVLGSALTARYSEGLLSGHAAGNLLLAGLLVECGDLELAIARLGELVGAVGRVLPATTTPTELRAELVEGQLVGQAAIARTAAVRGVSVLPEGVRPPTAALQAIDAAEQIVIGPGSLYTSVLAAAAVPALASAIRGAAGRRIYVCNLRPEDPETNGYSVADHVAALTRHGVEIDVVVWDSGSGLDLGDPQMAVVDSDLRGSNGLVHEPGKLAGVLAGLL